LARDIEADAGLVDLRGLGTQADVVAVEGDVENPHRDLRALDPGELRREPTSQVVAPVGDPDEREIVRPLVSFDDLVRDAGQGPAEVLVGQDRGGHTTTPPRADEEADRLWPICGPFPASRDRR